MGFEGVKNPLPVLGLLRVIAVWGSALGMEAAAAPTHPGWPKPSSGRFILRLRRIGTALEVDPELSCEFSKSLGLKGISQMS
jgi:hypothetical protein